MNELSKIYIIIRGGMLEAVYSDNDQLGVALLDFDDNGTKSPAELKDMEQMYAQIKQECAQIEHREASAFTTAIIKRRRTDMEFMGIQIDRSKLMSRKELEEYFGRFGQSDRILADIRDRYNEAFGSDLIWRYPNSDGYHLGFFIVPVQEGFLALPYDEVDREDYEIMIVDDAELLDADSLQNFIDDWQTYSEDLVGAMRDMIRILKQN